MSEMIEKVARAICAAGHFDPDSLLEGQLGYAGTGDRKFWTVFEPQARAAIEAMREPTLAMRKVCTFSQAEIVWPTMINAALG